MDTHTPPIEEQKEIVKNSPEGVPIPKAKKEKKKETWWDTVKYAILALIIVIPIRLFIAEPFIVSGHSMDPNFSSGEYLIINEIGYRFNDPTRGEVVVFIPPSNPKTYYIKRIIGMPGETISISQGIVTIKNTSGKTFILEEPYVTNKDKQNMSEVELNTDQYFVLGDNRPVSSDSRIWGPLPRKNMVGTPFLSLYPIKEIGIKPGAYNFDK